MRSSYDDVLPRLRYIVQKRIDPAFQYLRVSTQVARAIEQWMRVRAVRRVLLQKMEQRRQFAEPGATIRGNVIVRVEQRVRFAPFPATVHDVVKKRVDAASLHIGILVKIENGIE